MARDHLKEYQFKKGQSGNPNGRPKGGPGPTVRKLGHKFVAEVFEKIFILPEIELNKWLEENYNSLSRAEKVFMNNSEDLKHLNSLLDRVVGVPTKVEFTAGDEDSGIPIQFNIVRHSKHKEETSGAKDC